MTYGQPARRRHQAFTLTEILIVIGIIVLVIALAVPALSLMRGGNSVDSAQNNLSALLGRARADALGLQRPTGIFFFIDSATQNVMAAEVFAVPDSVSTGRQVYLDLVPDRDFVPLAKSVSAQVMDNAVITAGARMDNGYIGYNPYPVGSATPSLRYGGVILFDSAGRLYNPTYGFVFTIGTTRTKMADLFQATTAFLDPLAAPFPVAGFGISLYDREAFIAGSGASDETAANVDAVPFTAAERTEEQWLDDNSTPLLVNRYNGTFVRGD